MEITCKHCGSRFRAAIQLPLTAPVRVACPSCSNQMVLKPVAGEAVPTQPAAANAAAQQASKPARVAAIADEPRPFRAFLGEHLRRLGFDVTYFELGDPTLDFVRRTHADLVIVNV